MNWLEITLFLFYMIIDGPKHLLPDSLEKNMLLCLRKPDKKWISFNQSKKYLVLEKGEHGVEMSDEKFANCDSLWRPIFDARKN